METDNPIQYIERAEIGGVIGKIFVDTDMPSNVNSPLQMDVYFIGNDDGENLVTFRDIYDTYLRLMKNLRPITGSFPFVQFANTLKGDYIKFGMSSSPKSIDDTDRFISLGGYILRDDEYEVALRSVGMDFYKILSYREVLKENLLVTVKHNPAKSFMHDNNLNTNVQLLPNGSHPLWKGIYSEQMNIETTDPIPSESPLSSLRNAIIEGFAPINDRIHENIRQMANSSNPPTQEETDCIYFRNYGLLPCGPQVLSKLFGMDYVHASRGISYAELSVTIAKHQRKNRD